MPASALAPWIWISVALLGCASASLARAAVDANGAHGAVLQGLKFIRGLAESPEDFEELASDFIWCFATVATTASDGRVRQQATDWGRELAERWVRAHPRLPPAPRPDDVIDMAMSMVGVERLGLSHASLRAELEALIPSYGAKQLFGFDPREGPPPLMTLRLVGRESCVARGEQGDACPEHVRRVPNYDVWYDALITVWFGEAFGTPFGVPLADLMRHRAQLLPYLGADSLGEEAWFDEVYLVTHLVYAHNGYGGSRVGPGALAEERRFLLENVQPLLATGDEETYAELADTLASFGVTEADLPALADLRGRLLSRQNDDGSWGALDEPDTYTRFHTTWTAVDALRRYRWQ